MSRRDMGRDSTPALVSAGRSLPSRLQPMDTPERSSLPRAYWAASASHHMKPYECEHGVGQAVTILWESEPSAPRPTALSRLGIRKHAFDLENGHCLIWIK